VCSIYGIEVVLTNRRNLLSRRITRIVTDGVGECDLVSNAWYTELPVVVAD